MSNELETIRIHKGKIYKKISCMELSWKYYATMLPLSLMGLAGIPATMFASRASIQGVELETLAFILASALCAAAVVWFDGPNSVFYWKELADHDVEDPEVREIVRVDDAKQRRIGSSSLAC